MKRYLPYAIIAAVALVAAGAGATVYKAKQRRLAAAEAAATANLANPAGAKPGAKPAHVRGSVKAPVTIEEFADFQCPPCGGLSAVVKDIEKKTPDRIRVVFRHYPLKNHQHAVAAAIAAEAAGTQGKFWEMHDMLFQGQPTWSKAPEVQSIFEDYASTLRLDVARFKTDMADENMRTRVTADQERASSLGVSRTPTLFINGKALPTESLSLTGLQSAIDAAAAEGNKQAAAK
ncbi:MAG TPA: thioredoxin domain-containing protein [Chthoniobacterales bacterium]|nr:thioredoxin domain-containing protein [Chthoniobacterales bacterium]